ncbi:MAG: hypothetical protein LBI58_07155, partial [Tannerellaceae bacterium]|nr:hypothetical protein [Tannerellaceae bacterium]
MNEEEEGLGVPPLGSGYPLQFLVRCATLRSLWDFRFYPSRGFALLGRRPSATPPYPKHADRKTNPHQNTPKHAVRKTNPHPNSPKHADRKTNPYPPAHIPAAMTNRSPSDFDKNSSIIMTVGFISRKKLSRKLESILR